MSVLVANPCTSNASPKIYIAETAADIYFPRNGKPGDTVIVTKDSGFEIWKFKAEYDPIGTEGADWIAAKPCGYWVNIGNGEGRFSEFINVQNSPFNAVGDGVTDDTAAIQAAVAALLSGPKYSGQLYFPPGNYKITSTIEVQNASRQEIYGVEIYGAGIGKTTITAYDCDAFSFEYGDNWSVRDLFIVQDTALDVTTEAGRSSLTRDGIVISKMTHVSLSRVDIYGCRNGVYITGDAGVNNSHSISVQNSQMRYCQVGFKSDVGAVNSLRFTENNEVHHCNEGLWVSGVSILIEGNTIEAISNVGVRIGGAAYSVTIRDNYFEAIGPADGSHTGAAIEQGYGATAVLGLTIEGNFYNHDTGGGYGGGRFFDAIAGFVQGFSEQNNQIYPSLETWDYDFSGSTGYPGSSRSWGSHEIRTRDVLSGVVMNTDSADAGARNWFVGSNVSAYGDFAIVRSDAAGGDPKTAGTVMLEMDGTNSATETGLLLRAGATPTRVKVGANGTGPGGVGRALFVDDI